MLSSIAKRSEDQRTTIKNTKNFNLKQNRKSSIVKKPTKSQIIYSKLWKTLFRMIVKMLTESDSKLFIDILTKTGTLE